MDSATIFVKNRRCQANQLAAFGLLLLSIVVIGIHCQGDKSSTRGIAVIDSAGSFLDQTAISRGICVVLGDSTGSFALDLASKSELVIYLQYDSDRMVDKIRRAMDVAGLYGTRIYVETGDVARIHLADNLADALVALDDPGRISRSEALRVLRPKGIALVGNHKWLKPFPDGIDDWRHPYHGPDNNTQSNDKVIQAPYLTQFLADPRYGPIPQVAVASAGRVFKGFGNVAFHEREEPWLNTLAAFNGYNGTLLWKRDLNPGMMLHRNIIIATPTVVYLGDDQSCKLIDPATGRLMDEIILPPAIAGGTCWKWLALENEVLYALVGDQEQKDGTMRWRRTRHGWPWDAISPGFNQPEHPWGFGRYLFAINPKTKKVLWHHQEQEPMDSRALCMKNGRIYIFRFGSYLACLNANNGKTIWRKTIENSPELFNTFGDYLHRQSWQTNWRTRNYLLCSDQALYFAGPQVGKLLVLSAQDGTILWENSYDNFQLVLREDGLYGISGPWGNLVSKKFDPLTGAILAELPTARRACTRPNGSSDAIFYRAMGGSVRFDLASNRPGWISPMRPSCHDGVTIANGHLYWWPSVCDCQLSIYGITCLGSAEDFEFNAQALESERLEQSTGITSGQQALLATPNDWPTFRKDNSGSVTTAAAVSATGELLWRYRPNRLLPEGVDLLGHPFYSFPTAPVTVDGLVFISGADGIVRALNATTGEMIWTAYTGGAVRMPPTIWQGQVFVGSGDGWVYKFDARTGDLIWRFRVAPVERKIPVYGSLLSTWPAASGVLVDNGIAYVAAGILNYDGTHVYALDAVSGGIKWQNNSSGHLEAAARTGVSVQGHMLLHDGKLFLAGGTSVSPAIYDISDGKCLNDPEPLKRCESYSPRGWELYKIGDQIVVGGKPYYSHPQYPVYDHSVVSKMLIASTGNRDLTWTDNRTISCYPTIDRQQLNKSVAAQRFTGYVIPAWGRLEIADPPWWQYHHEEGVALAVCQNAVVLAARSEIVVLNLANGKVRWSEPLEHAPVPWGLAITRDGRVIVSLENGEVLCYGGQQTVATPYVRSEKYFTEKTNIILAGEPGTAEIRYTLDGSEPTAFSDLYTRPISVEKTTMIKMRTFKDNMAQSFITTAAIKKLDYLEATRIEAPEPGLLFTYYEGFCSSVTALADLPPVKSGKISHVTLGAENPGTEQFGFEFEGYIKVEADGIYTFYLASNDGSQLFMDGKLLVDNDGPHGLMERSGTVALRAGHHAITVKYFQMGAGKTLTLCWDSVFFDKQQVPAKALFHNTGA